MILYYQLTKKGKAVSRLLLAFITAAVMTLAGCSETEEGVGTIIDDDGDIVSNQSTGFQLPQSVQTIPSETTASLKRKHQVEEAEK